MRLVMVLLTALGAALPARAATLELVIEGLTAPIDIADPGDGRLFVLEQHGLVQVIGADGALGAPLLDLRPRLLPLREDFEERGLLGFALHPDFAANGRLYVSYTAPLRPGAPEGWSHTRRISELTLMPGETTVGLGTERVLMEIDWPSRKHNGGGLAFGADGMLLIGLGDGGGAHGIGPDVIWSAFEVPPGQLHWDRLAQDLASPFGKILRIDVDRGFPGYGIPPGNPFARGGGMAEVWAWGFRNPYRLGVDARTGAVAVTAVAETLWEAVYLVAGPGNFGWPIREGTHCVDRLAPWAPPADCPRSGAEGWPIADPVVEYPNMQVMAPESTVEAAGLGTAVTGARIYRGAALPDLAGRMIVTDWSASFETPSGQVFAATPAPEYGALWALERIAVLETRIVGLAADRAGELYVLTNENFGPYGQTGRIWRLVP